MKKYLRLRLLVPLVIGIFVVFGYGCQKEKEPLLTVLFTFNPESGFVYDTITFTNTSQNANSYSWDFGDDNNSTIQNPTHVYTTAGTFTITLLATGDGGTSTATKTIEITIPPFNIVPGVRIGDFKLSDNFQTLKSFLTETTGLHIIATLSNGKYIHLLFYDNTGIGFAFLTSSYTLYNSDIPDEIFAYPPFEGNTEKGITFESLLTDVVTSYGTPEEISSYGDYYYNSIGIYFFADETETKVSQIGISIPGTKSKSLSSILNEITMRK